MKRYPHRKRENRTVSAFVLFKKKKWQASLMLASAVRQSRKLVSGSNYRQG